MEAKDKIKDFACVVDESQFEEFVKAAELAGVSVYRPNDYDDAFPIYLWDGEDLCGHRHTEGRKLISFKSFIAKLNGEPESMNKAEALERYNIIITD